MNIIDALLKVLKDSPPNAALRKCDIEAAKAMLAPAPAPAPPWRERAPGSDAAALNPALAGALGALPSSLMPHRRGGRDPGKRA